MLIVPDLVLLPGREQTHILDHQTPSQKRCRRGKKEDERKRRGGLFSYLFTAFILPLRALFFSFFPPQSDSPQIQFSKYTLAHDPGGCELGAVSFSEEIQIPFDCIVSENSACTDWLYLSNLNHEKVRLASEFEREFFEWRFKRPIVEITLFKCNWAKRVATKEETEKFSKTSGVIKSCSFSWAQFGD